MDPMIEFEPALRDRLAVNLDRHQARTHELEGRKHAAVAVVVIDSDAELHGHDPTELDRVSLIGSVPGADLDVLTGRIDGTAGGAAVILTRRGSRLRAHSNQWALPGGRIDAGETPLEAAMREVGEEIGLQVSEQDGESVVAFQTRHTDGQPVAGVLGGG
jgi:8-oxo-dGTP pyrophosphatase MutT (NUDIX family)